MKKINVNFQEIRVDFNLGKVWSEESAKASKELKDKFEEYIKEKLGFSVYKTTFTDNTNYRNADNGRVRINFNCSDDFSISLWAGDNGKKGGMYKYDWNFIEQKYADVYINRFLRFIEQNIDDYEVVDKREEEKKKKKLTAKERILENYRVNICHKPFMKNLNFKLEDLDGKYETWNYNGKEIIDSNTYDRDKKIIHNGDIKAFRDYNGRLEKGKVYYDLNMNWFVIVNDKTLKTISCWDLFDLTEDDLKCRRKVVDIKPISYLEKICDKDSPEMILLELLRSDLTCRKLANVCASYCDYRGIEKKDNKIKNQESYFEIEGRSWGWNKIHCNISNGDKYFSITYRVENYLIIYNANGDRIFEIDRKIRHYNKEELQEVYNNFKPLFKDIKNRVDKGEQIK